MPKFSLTAKPYYLGADKKPIEGTWIIEADNISEALWKLSQLIEGTPGDSSKISVDKVS